MYGDRFNRRALLGKTALLAGSLPVISSVIAACIGDDDEIVPTSLPALDTATPAPTAFPEPPATAAATMTSAPTATTTPVPTAIATEPAVPTAAPTLIPADPDLLAGLTEIAIPFESAEPESSLQDLELFREIVGDARIAALGEATHGTSEFFKMKHKLVELLVTELGFTIFAIEAPWPATKQINRYVHGADAIRAEILAGLTFWTWQTQEVLDLIEWMRDYNARPGVTPVSFEAFDMQVGSTDYAVNQVLAYMKEVDPDALEQFENYYAPTSNDGRQAALDDLLVHRDTYAAADSTEPFEDIVQTARMIVQDHELEDYRRSSDPERFVQGSALRDRYMAENVTWLLDRGGPDAKIMLWAHNAHVAVAEATSPGGATIHGMGSRLRDKYGDELITVGFDFFSGTFNAPREFQIPPPSPEHVEYIFAQLGFPRFMLDLGTVTPGSAASDWLLEEHRMWSIGAGYDPDAAERASVLTILPQVFDVLIYFQVTSASHRLS